jgi:hypothetical protein
MTQVNSYLVMLKGRVALIYIKNICLS